ncbi:hypothetical protein F5X99DRAFT_391149 [Biscogniauxia marginata]|nr:hypothetical protein F5X99DRAFT_391149 [Biscogniauxia marginata]
MAPGILLLRAAPLLASTSFGTATICEKVYFRPFATPKADNLRPQANRLLAAHVRAFTKPAVSITLSLFPLGIAAGLLNVLRRG